MLDLEPAGVPDPLLGVSADVTDEESVASAVAEVASRFGRLDVLVNNAGIGAQGTVEDNDLDRWRRVLDVNLLGVVRMTRAVLSLTLAMAADHIGDGVRVNCVNPGTVETPWVTRLLTDAANPDAERATLMPRQPIGRLVAVDEVAYAVAYLASPRSGSVTGTALAVDGGMSGLRLRATT